MHDKAGHHRKNARKSSVDRRRMTGVGCFGKPSTLINMLHRLMAQHERDAGRTNALKARPSPVNCAVCRLMNRLTLELRAAGVVSSSSDDQRKRVAGFFLYMDHDRARISVFTRNDVIRTLQRA